MCVVGVSAYDVFCSHGVTCVPMYGVTWNVLMMERKSENILSSANVKIGKRWGQDV